MPSPETWRFQAGSKILPVEPAAGIATLAVGDAGRSEQLCKQCGHALDHTHDHHDLPPLNDVNAEPEPDDVIGLDAFEKAMHTAASTHIAKTKSMKQQPKSMKQQPPKKRPAAAGASLKRPAAAMKSTEVPSKTRKTQVPGWSLAQR